MTTYVFPGQGSQSRGMGVTLFSEFPDLVAKADSILNYSVAKLCLEDTEDVLNQTNYTQPAIYVVNALSYLKKISDTGKKPDFVAGHSLGEYNALLAAEVFDFETGLQLVKKRGELMIEAAGGGMAVIVGLSKEVVQSVLADNNYNLTDICIANYNSNRQFVISGPKESVLGAEPMFLRAGAIFFMPLKVSGAFHSTFMSNAQRQFADFLGKYSFNAPKIPVIANVDAKPYTVETVSANLTQQITHPLLWIQTIEYLIAQGETDFQEVGQGRILTGLISQIQKKQ